LLCALPAIVRRRHATPLALRACRCCSTCFDDVLLFITIEMKDYFALIDSRDHFQPHHDAGDASASYTPGVTLR